MIVLIGKSASGKDTILNKLIENGYKKIITYTTRPMRKNETQDKTYHFISEGEFKNKVEDGFFVEWKSYITNNGVWYYGSAKEDYDKSDDKTLVILTPDGYRDIINSLGYRPKSIYIYANNSTIRGRLQKRGDDKNEVIRRIEHDNEDFKGVEKLADRIVYNNRESKIDDVINIIENTLHKWREDERK